MNILKELRRRRATILSSEITFIVLSTIFLVQLSRSFEIAKHASDDRSSLGDIIELKHNLEPEAKQKSRPPVIGVLTEVFRGYKKFVPERSIFIASSYVKWLESAGAQVVPVMTNQNDSYYEQIVAHTNGLLLPGGDNMLDPLRNTPMMTAAKKLYQAIKNANDAGDYYPIMGICLGFELMSVLSSNRNELELCNGSNVVLPVDTVERGKMFAPDMDFAPLPMDYSGWVFNDLLRKPEVAFNQHHKCLTDAGLSRAGLSDFYRPLGYSTDPNGFRFIAIMEANEYPFWGLQFHPEKAAFEFVAKKSQSNVAHTATALISSRYFADFFVHQARKNNHQWTDSPLLGSLIYNYSPNHLAPLGDGFEQRYLWPFKNNGLDDGEFIDHVLATSKWVPDELTKPNTLRPS